MRTLTLLLLALILAIAALTIYFDHTAHAATHRNACARHPACRARVFARWERQRQQRLARQQRHMASALASWYGPGLYGNRTACGQTLTPGLPGVAHKTLACGTRLLLCAARCATATVIDRGPYVAGREFDLTAATKGAIGAGSLTVVRYRVTR